MELSKNTLLARRKMEENGYTCILQNEETEYHSTLHGVKPLLDWIREGVEAEGFSAADQIIGKAAALLYVKLGVRELYAGVISAPGKKVLEEHKIVYDYGKETDYIVNRRGDGMCPMEMTVAEISDPDEAVAALWEKHLILSGQKKQ